MDRMWFFLWRLWRNPPSRRRAAIMMAALALALLLVLIERYVGWPSWMTVERMPRHRLPPL